MKNNQENIVYIVQHKEWPKYTKIGITDNLSKRISTLNTASPTGIKILYTQKVKHKELVEKYLHIMFAKYRCHGEWFQLSKKQILNAILEIDMLSEK